MKIRFFTEYGSHPVWRIVNGSPENTPPEELEIPSDLRERLADWNRRYQSTLNQQYPPDSKFDTNEELAAFCADEKTLAAELAKHYDEVEYLPTKW